MYKQAVRAYRSAWEVVNSYTLYLGDRGNRSMKRVWLLAAVATVFAASAGWMCGARMLSQGTPDSVYQLWSPVAKTMRSLGDFDSIKAAEEFVNKLAAVRQEDLIPEDD